MAGEIKRIAWSDFAHGLSVVDSPIDSAHFPMISNLQPVGDRLRSRFGFVQTTTATEAQIVFMYHASTTGRLFTVAANGIVRCYTTNLGPWTISAGELVGTLPSAQGYGFVSIVELNNLYVIACIDGVFTCSTAAGSLSAVVTPLPNGGKAAVWQNKVWAAAASNRIYFSNPGDPSVWTTATDFVDIAEISAAPVTAIGAGAGYDIIGQNQLNVFKRGSWYRIVDSSTGEYQTMSSEHGASATYSLTRVADKVFFGNHNGVYMVQGSGQSVDISAPIRSGGPIGTVVVAANDHVCVSGIGSLSNWYEYIPDTGAWFAMHYQGVGVAPGFISARIPELWYDQDGVVWVSATNQLLIHPAPATGQAATPAQTLANLDPGATTMVSKLQLPALSGRGSKMRFRNAYLTARSGGAATAVEWQISREVMTNAFFSSGSTRNLIAYNLTTTMETSIRASLGTHEQLTVALDFTATAPANISAALGLTNSLIPNLEIAEVALDFIEVGH